MLRYLCSFETCTTMLLFSYKEILVVFNWLMIEERFHLHRASDYIHSAKRITGEQDITPFPMQTYVIDYHWFRLWLGAEQVTSHYLDPRIQSVVKYKHVVWITRSRWVNEMHTRKNIINFSHGRMFFRQGTYNDIYMSKLACYQLGCFIWCYRTCGIWLIKKHDKTNDDIHHVDRDIDTDNETAYVNDPVLSTLYTKTMFRNPSSIHNIPWIGSECKCTDQRMFILERGLDQREATL